MSQKLSISNSKSTLAAEEKQFWCNWKEYITKSDEEIEKDLLSFKKQHKSFMFINEYLQNEFEIPIKLSNTIILYLPIKETQKNELIAHLDVSPLTKKAIKDIQTRARENITRFLNITETKGMLSPHKIENPIQMLDYYIYEIYWYRMGIQKYCEGYPFQPSDILGILRNNEWFYYKDGHPQQFNKKHRQMICLTAKTLKQLLLKMDYRDVNNFVYNYTRWSPMDLKRCGCNQCYGYYDDDGKPKPLKLLILPSETNKTYQNGNELQISLIGGGSVKKSKKNKCCSCVIL